MYKHPCYSPNDILDKCKYIIFKVNSQRRNMEVGDVVIIKDEDLFRGNWKLGRDRTVRGGGLTRATDRDRNGRERLLVRGILDGGDK